MPTVLKPVDPKLKHLALTLDSDIESHELYQGKLSCIIDGDTLEVDLAPIDAINFTGSGRSTGAVQFTELIERVRLLGIDAPEAHAGDHASRQCQYLAIDINLLLQLAKLSTIHLQWLCPKGAKPTIKTTGKVRDEYGRILAGVFVGDLCINQLMVEHGYAMAYQGYSDWENGYKNLEAQAKDAKRGIWGQYEEPYYTVSASSKKYHRPVCGSAPKAGARIDTVKEAKAKGFKPCPICMPDFPRI